MTGARGLSSLEARRRLERDGPNELPEPPRPGLARVLLDELLEPLALVLLGAAALSSLALRDHLEAGAILAIVLLNVAISAAQRVRADAAMASLRSLAAPTAKALRDGAWSTIPARELVPGDTVAVAAGDRVPADLELSAAESLEADEAILTGESLPVGKGAGEGEDRAAHAGTLVLRGRGEGTVVATGLRTRMGAIARQLAADTEPPLEAELRRVAWRITAGAAAAAAVLLAVVWARSGGGAGGLGAAALAAVALGVAAIPEGLVAVVTVALALGVQRMSRKGTIVRRMRAVQGLGSATVLCVDKTGTLTEASVVVAQAVPLGEPVLLWEAAVRCNDAGGGHGDPLELALLEAAAREGAAPAGRRAGERPFDPCRRSMATLHETPQGPLVTLKGAPETVAAACAGDPRAGELVERAQAMAREGMRVLAFAHGRTRDLGSAALEPLGLVGFADPVRASACRAVGDCRRAGIRVVMVTGDHPGTAAAVARQVGLDAGPVAVGAGLEALGAAERARALAEASVVARVEPSTKVALVDAHRAAGHVVVMMGDGVNDAPALKRADVGVAVAGKDSTDVAREAADIVLTSGDLGTLVEGVREGRRVYANLRAVVAYLLAGNASEVLVVLLGLALFPELLVPLTAVQLLWVNLATDGLPAIALGVDRPAGDPLALRPAGRAGQLLPARQAAVLLGRGLLMAAAVLAAGWWARSRGAEGAELQTQLLVALLAVHLAMAYGSRAGPSSFGPGWWRNWFLLLAVAGSLALQGVLFAVPLLREAMGLVVLPPEGWLAAAVAAGAVLALVDLGRVVGSGWARRAAGRA